MIKQSILFGILSVLLVPPAAAQVARVKQSVGAAAIERGTKRLPASPGLQLNTGDRLVTGKNGRISVTFVDNTRFAIGPDSNVAISQFDYDRTRQRGVFVTQVNRGSLAVVSGKIAKSGRDAMKVRTPNSLLGVRGTRFIVEVPK
ncbi:MAG: FecR domain-containing protein [Pseudomonadota bacterium]